MGYKGTGTFTDFVEYCSKILDAVQGSSVNLSAGMGGSASLGIEGTGGSASLVLDLSDAPIFTLDNIVWKTREGATITQQSAEIIEGVLYIHYTAS